MTTPKSARASTLRDLITLVQQLRGPEGCPWDQKQTLPDLRAYLIEEAHEAAAAIDSRDWNAIREELGDLLFQVAFLLGLAEEEGAFGAESVVAETHQKMVERHPHVFGDRRLKDADAVHRAWERRKIEAGGPDRGLLAGVPNSLPALVGAFRMSQKAAGVGFDWPDRDGVLDKVREELEEVEVELETAPSPAVPSPNGGLREEIGDLLFAVANLARHSGIDPEAALAGTNVKFRQRFAAVEAGLAAQGRPLAEATLAEMESLWQAAKDEEGS